MRTSSTPKYRHVSTRYIRIKQCSASLQECMSSHRTEEALRETALYRKFSFSFVLLSSQLMGFLTIRRGYDHFLGTQFFAIWLVPSEDFIPVIFKSIYNHHVEVYGHWFKFSFQQIIYE